MCRDGQCLPTTAQLALGRLLHDLADALVREAGGTAEDVVIGPVDFGEAYHAPDYRPLAGNDHLTCAECYEPWPCDASQPSPHSSGGVS